MNLPRSWIAGKESLATCLHCSIRDDTLEFADRHTFPGIDRMAKKKVVKPKPTKKAKKVVKKKVAKKTGAKKKPASLGRPAVTAEEQLYMLFKDDYHARQIFEFLRVATVGELEHYSPDEIIRRLSRPVAESVDRIRRTLAEKNRCLSGDLPFALEHKANRPADS